METGSLLAAGSAALLVGTMLLAGRPKGDNDDSARTKDEPSGKHRKKKK